MLKALRNTMIYHLGSVALGAFIIAIIQFVRVRSLSVVVLNSGWCVCTGRAAKLEGMHLA